MEPKKIPEVHLHDDDALERRFADKAEAKKEAEKQVAARKNETHKDIDTLIGEQARNAGVPAFVLTDRYEDVDLVDNTFEGAKARTTQITDTEENRGSVQKGKGNRYDD